jgi:hypothetical protein
MTLIYLTILSLLASPLLSKAEGEVEFSYDPNASNGPNNWKDLLYEDGHTENTCGGDSNSPIAIVGSSCNKNADYVFTVSY